MFYVYSGYVSPDNYDSSESQIYTLTEFRTAEEVAAAKTAFDGDLHSDCSNAIFRVIEGKERSLNPILVVKEWSLD